MKTFLIAALALAGLLAISSGCRKPAAIELICDTGIINLQCDSIFGPATVAIGSKVAFYVSFSIDNGCGTYNGLEATTSGHTISLSIKGQYKGCFCTDVFYSVQKPWEFGASEPGTYTIQVLHPTGAPKVHTFTVQ